MFDALGKEYIALNPLGTEDVYLYGYKEYEEDYELIDIADEDEFAKVVKEFEKLASRRSINENDGRKKGCSSKELCHFLSWRKL